VVSQKLTFINLSMITFEDATAFVDDMFGVPGVVEMCGMATGPSC
jgi:hypothetical protein